MTKPKGIHWFTLILAYLSLFAYGLVDNARGPVFPDVLQDFRLTDAQGSYFFFIASSAALANNVLAFRLIRNFGSFRSLQFYSVMQALGLAIIGWAPNYSWTLVGCAVFGTSFGGLGIAHNALVAESTAPSIRRRALSGLHCMYGVASLLAPLYISGMYHLGVGWQFALSALAIGPIAIGFASLHENAPNKALPKRSESSGQGRASWGETAFFACLISAYVVAELSISTRLVLFARRDGYSIDAANLLLTLYFVGLFLGRLLFTVAHIPLSNRRVLVLSAAVGFLTYTLGLVHSPLWLPLTGLAIAMFYPVAINMVHDEVGEGGGAVMQWGITLQALALMLMHIAIGRISDLAGIRWALSIGPISLAALLVLLAARAYKKPNFPVENSPPASR